MGLLLRSPIGYMNLYLQTHNKNENNSRRDLNLDVRPIFRTFHCYLKVKRMADISDPVTNHTLASRLDVPNSTKNESALKNTSPETPSVLEDLQLSAVGDETNPQRQITGFRWLLICTAIFSGNILYGLDTTIAADIQASVYTTFENVTQLGWLGIGFTLGSTVTILPLGKAYARFDNKWVFINCLTMFAAGSALCGAAPSMIALILGRVWAGAGGAGVYLG